MRFLNLIRQFYRKNIATKVLYWLILIIISVALSLLIETVFFHFKQTFYSKIDSIEDIITDMEFDNTTFHPEEDNTFISISEEDASIEFFFEEPVYIDKFEFRIIPFDDKPVSYEFTSDTLYKGVDYIYFAEIYPGETDVVSIDAVCDSLTLNIENSNMRRFQIDFGTVIYDAGFNFVRFLLVTLAIFMSLTVLSCLFGIIRFSLSELFLVNALIMCFIMSFFIPPNYLWDDASHLTRDIYLAEGHLFVDENTQAAFPYNYKYLSERNYRSLNDFYRYLEDLENPDGGNRLEEEETIETSAATYLFFPYIFGALGVKIAQIFDLSAFYYSAFARFANALVFIILGYFGIKLFSGNKLLLFFLSLTPMMCYMCCSAGPTSIIVGTLLFIVGVVSYYRRTGKMLATWKYVGLLILLTMMTFARMTNGFFFLLLLLIPKRQFESGFLRHYNLLILLVISIGLMSFIFFYSMNVSGFHEFQGYEIDPKKQLMLVLTHPFTFLRRFWNLTELKMFTFNMGGDMVNTIYNGKLTGFYGLLAIGVVILTTFSGNPKMLTVNNNYSRFIMLFSTLLVYGATVASMYVTMTEVNGGDILGMQTRYIIPLLIVILPCLETKRFYLVNQKTAFPLIVIGISLLICLAEIGLIMTRYYM